MGGLPASGTTPAGRARLITARLASPDRPAPARRSSHYSAPYASRARIQSARVADDILKGAGQRARTRGWTPGRQRAGDRGPYHCPSVTASGTTFTRPRSGSRTCAPPALIEALITQAASAEVEGHRFTPRFLIRRVGARLSTPGNCDVGGLSRRRPAWPQDTHRRQAARNPVVDFRAGPGRVSPSGASLPGPICSAGDRTYGSPAANRRSISSSSTRRRMSGVAELRFLAALAASRPDGLFFAGDLGQRIFQQPFSWRCSRRRCPGPSSRCGSTTAPRTRSAPRPTGCCRPRGTDVDGKRGSARHGLGVQRPGAGH